jgi:hypothetical protein
MSSPRLCVRSGLAVIGLVLSVSVCVAQPDQELVEVDPIRCWWRTSHGSVSVGQPFTLVLTCAVVETDAVRVVPDESPLAVGTVQLAPFELLGGSHPADLRRGQRRFFQYDYALRLIDPTAIGRDISLPQLTIHYRVESRLQSEALEGRDRTYVLPAHSVRIASNVPADAPDIRDASDAPFGAIETTRFRARLFEWASLALGALGFIVLVPAAVRALGLARTRPKADTLAASPHTVLRRATAELAEVRQQGQGGWDDRLIARALAAVRLLAGYAIARPPRQHALSRNTDVPDSRLVVTQGLLRRRRVSVASAVTAADLSRAIDRLPETGPTERRALLEQLRQSLTTLSRAQYGAGAAKHEGIEEAVQEALSAGWQVRREHAWWREVLRRVGHAR